MELTTSNFKSDLITQINATLTIYLPNKEVQSIASAISVDKDLNDQRVKNSKLIINENSLCKNFIFRDITSTKAVINSFLCLIHASKTSIDSLKK